MHAYTLTHLSDAALLRDLAALITRDRITTAALLAHIAEVDARRLYLPAGYSSMHAYCVDELRLSEDAAYKRIRAARAARQFPAVFTELAEGRLHLAAVCLLAPHLTPQNAEELLAAAGLRRKSEIEELLAQRFAVPTIVRANQTHQLAPGRVGCTTASPVQGQLEPEVERSFTGPAPDDQHAPAHVERSSILLQLAIGKSTHDKLRYAQALLSHSVRSDDVAQVLDRALDALIVNWKGRRSGPPPSGLRVNARQQSRRRKVSALEAVTSRRTCGVPYGIAMGVNARSSARRGTAARRAGFSNSTMSTRWHAAARRPSTACG